MSMNQALQRRATIIRYHKNGTVSIRIDEVGSAQAPQEYTVPMPLSWSGPNGEFIGGFPVAGSSCVVSRSQGGQWFIDSYINSDFVFESGLMSALIPGRAMMQVAGGNRAFVDPKLGFQAGGPDSFLHVDPVKNIISHNFKAAMGFSDASRMIDGPIKRDVIENSTRGLLGSTLTSHIYDDTLFTISLDPTTTTSITTAGERIRNPALAEKREVVYEFADSFNIDSDADESDKYTSTKPIQKPKLRRDNRADAFSLSQFYPNHLIETVKGTAVDSFGNILDLNRVALPIGRLDNLSLRKNSDKVDAFARIKGQHRRAMAYHFEINVKKPITSGAGVDVGAVVSPTPDVNDNKDYARNRSKFFVDVDKEGQFKINVPASSETGNIPLLTRYENYSVLLAAKKGTSPHVLVRNALSQEIFTENFAGKATIKLKSSESTLDGYEAPLDRFTNQPILFGTAYHDITKACNTFLPKTPGTTTPVVLAPFDLSHNINKTTPYDKIVSDTITVSGESADAGGRSGSMNLDGWFMLTVGANTIDRQSVWADYAGSIISQVGRDKRGISYAANLDGDMIIQIGGAGIGNSFDSRFSDENDAARPGTFDLRVLNGNSLMSIIRVDVKGVSIITPGRLDISSGQDMIFKSKGRMYFNAEQVFFYADTGLIREVERKRVNI